MAYGATGDEPLLTAEEFRQLPEDGWRSELVAGRVVREPPPGAEHGRLAHRVAYLLERFVRAHDIGVVFSECGFIVEDGPATVRAPDVALVRSDRMPERPVTGYFPGPPDLAVEVISPTNRATEIQAKVREYLEGGARMVWVVYPETRTVAVHESPRSALFLDETGTLTGGDVLPGLEIPVAEIFD